MVKSRARLAPIHPGEILREEFLNPLGMSANKLAQSIKVPAGRITQILNGQRAITADTALRLSRFFGTTPELWINLQSHYELQLVEESLAGEIAESITPYTVVIPEKKKGRVK